MEWRGGVQTPWRGNKSQGRTGWTVRRDLVRALMTPKSGLDLKGFRSYSGLNFTFQPISCLKEEVKRGHGATVMVMALPAELSRYLTPQVAAAPSPTLVIRCLRMAPHGSAQPETPRRPGACRGGPRREGRIGLSE